VRWTVGSALDFISSALDGQECANLTASKLHCIKPNTMSSLVLLVNYVLRRSTFCSKTIRNIVKVAVEFS
jgi:hypothetical protein